jgi:ABC-type sugar transport system ATPase subunit
MAEIAAAVSEDARVLFLDEPTSSLTANEIDNLFVLIRRLRDSGVGIVYVSHRLEEVLAICDRVTVMRDGETVETRSTSSLTMDHIVSTMVGRTVEDMFAKRSVPIGEPRLRVEHASSKSGAFKDVSIEVRAGEIVGVYGFVGAGRSEFGQALFGLHPMASGSVSIDGKPFKPRRPRKAVRAGLAYLPEDRLVQGVFRNQSLRTNASVASLRELSTAGWVRPGAERALVSRVMTQMNVRAESSEQPIGTLSGGNQQKVVFGRWQSTAPKILILDEPTRGVDVGAKAEIYRLIRDLAARGLGTLFISSDLPELLLNCDRILVMRGGRISGELTRAAATPEKVLELALPLEVAS